MPRSAAPTRNRIITAAHALFYAHGYNRTGLDEIAAAARLTKRTLYQHFDSKDALLGAVMEHDVALSMPRISRWMAAMDADPTTGIDEVFAELAAWAQSPGWTGAGFTRIVMELADLPGHPAHRIARAHKQAIATRLTQALGSAERAAQFMITVEGTLILLMVQLDLQVLEAGRRMAHQIAGTRRSDKPDH
jgi:AcrR family transcriptional regulator